MKVYKCGQCDFVTDNEAYAREHTKKECFSYQEVDE